MMDLPRSDGEQPRRKRGWHDRADGDDEPVNSSEKRHRPMSGESSSSWHPRDSVISSPPVPGQPDVHKPKYDSDDQSSMMSEPGSPQELGNSSGDEEMEDVGAYSSERSPPFTPSSRPFAATSDPAYGATQHGSSNVVNSAFTSSTPQPPPPPGSSPTPFRSAARYHMRHRHPQENLSSPQPTDRLAVPLAIEENNAATPPSASADATGSQLSMLSFNDMDIEPAPDLPSISIDTETHHQPPFVQVQDFLDDDSPFASSTTPHSEQQQQLFGGADNVAVIRKQRQRSGALSAGGSPAPPISPSSPSMFNRPPPQTEAVSNVARRGLSMGFRPDCEKCRLKVPGHMNHFVA